MTLGHKQGKIALLLKILLLLNHDFGKDVQIRLAELSFPIFPLLKDTITEDSRTQMQCN